MQLNWFVRHLWILWYDVNLFSMLNKIFRNSRRNSQIQFFLYTVLQSKFLRQITFLSTNVISCFKLVKNKKRRKFTSVILFDSGFNVLIQNHSKFEYRQSPPIDTDLKSISTQPCDVTKQNISCHRMNCQEEFYTQISNFYPSFTWHSNLQFVHEKEPRWRPKSEPMQVPPHLFQPLHLMPIRRNPNYLTKLKAVQRKFLQPYSFQTKMELLVLVPIGKYSAPYLNIPFYSINIEEVSYNSYFPWNQRGIANTSKTIILTSFSKQTYYLQCFMSSLSWNCI